MTIGSRVPVVAILFLVVAAFAPPSVATTVGDYDGDGKTDVAVWRPSNGVWFVIPSSNPSAPIIQQWGTQGDIPVPGDYDGDGKTDFAVWRPSTGQWFIIPSRNPSAPIVQQWGTQGDIPVPGDYDGDGKTDFAVWRPSTGTWFIIPSSNPSAPIIRQWGANGDMPVPGNYDGDGKTDMAAWRPSTGQWFIIPSSNPSAPIVQQWGTQGDIPVPGDYDGDGKTDFAVWRPSMGTWFIIPSSNPSAPIIQQWGTQGDMPVPGDYDGDRKTDFAVWRPSTGQSFVIPSSTSSTFTITQWGTLGDIPGNRPVGTTPTWTLVWNDEFGGANGSAPDPAKWTYDTGGNGWGNNELEYYTSRLQNAQMQNGNLVITAIQETYTGPDNVTRNYTSARLKTQNLFTQAYGRFEARIKIPFGQGLWPAFWMLGNDIGTVGWPQCGEIDIMENIGREPGTVHGSLHGPKTGGGTSDFSAPFSLPSGQRFTDDFHLYAVEWEPGTIRFYVDSSLYATEDSSQWPAGGQWVFDHPFFIILNVAVGGNWPGSPDATTVFPQTMLVDYVRVYQRSD